MARPESAALDKGRHACGSRVKQEQEPQDRYYSEFPVNMRKAYAGGDRWAGREFVCLSGGGNVQWPW